MAQDAELIGQASPELEAVAAEKQGWQGQTSRPQIDEMSGDWDFSFRDRRANRQAQGFPGPGLPPAFPNYPGHVSEPMAAHTVNPWGDLDHSSAPAEREI